MFSLIDPMVINPVLAVVTNWGSTLYEQYQFWKIPLQFLLVFVVVSWLYFKIYGTYIAQLLKGVAVILALHLLAGILGFTIISGILQVVLQISIIGFIIIFQPELRRLLVYLGQPDLFGKQTLTAGGKEKNAEHLINELVESLRLLSKTKTGALIVLESTSGSVGTYLEAGTRLEARLSTELLLTIFHTNTPLHDGAVIVSPDGRLLAAGVLLPLSENPNLSWKYGTRHRAAIGLTEISDSRCLVVSEETGNISMVFSGTIQKINATDELRRQLELLYGIAPAGEKSQKRLLLGEFLSRENLQRLFSKNPGKPAPERKSHPPEDRAKIGS